MEGLKRVISISLLIFVAFSVVYLAVGKREVGNSAPIVTKENSEGRGESEEHPPAKSVSEGVTTVAYYFHRTARCRTCRALENTAREAIEEEFSSELSSGTLSIMSVNVEEATNRHFIEHYRITGPSLVLSKMDGGKEVNWKNLDQIWNLIRTPGEYKAYVISELKSIMKVQS